MLKQPLAVHDEYKRQMQQCDVATEQQLNDLGAYPVILGDL